MQRMSCNTFNTFSVLEHLPQDDPCAAPGKTAAGAALLPQGRAGGALAGGAKHAPLIHGQPGNKAARLREKGAPPARSAGAIAARATPDAAPHLPRPTAAQAAAAAVATAAPPNAYSRQQRAAQTRCHGPAPMGEAARGTGARREVAAPLRAPLP
ncbi:hypothetical protein MNEG_14516, partial [Monoraphidium neglectum]